jgi:hypothetical protein
MNDSAKLFITAVIVSIAAHAMLAVAYSAYRRHVVVTTSDTAPRAFDVFNARLAKVEAKPAPTPTKAAPALSKTPMLSDAPPVLRSAPALPIPPVSVEAELLVMPATEIALKPPGPFISPIDPKHAWINVAESVNYDLMRGVTMDISQGEYRLSGEVDVRVRARGDLAIEYPLFAAALGKEAVLYVLLLIDEQGRKNRVEVIRGDIEFHESILQALERVEFRPAMLKNQPVKALLLLEFEFRRAGPDNPF